MVVAACEASRITELAADHVEHQDAADEQRHGRRPADHPDTPGPHRRRGPEAETYNVVRSLSGIRAVFKTSCPRRSNSAAGTGSGSSRAWVRARPRFVVGQRGGGAAISSSSHFSTGPMRSQTGSEGRERSGGRQRDPTS